MANQKKEPSISQVIQKRRASVIIANSYRSLLFQVLGLALVLYILFGHVFLLTQVTGNEMFPALEDGDVILAYRLHERYMKNDVIVYEHEGKLVTGRVLGRDGDVINMDDSGALQVNGTNQGGEIMYPTYAKEGITYPYVVPDGCLFIIEDYRTQCEDSRDFGPISDSDVVGKVITLLRRRGI